MTEPNPEQEISIPLRIVTMPGCPDGLSTIACLNCHETLDIHQPDGELPDRLLATCSACQGWHVIECDSESKDALIVLLPDFTLARKASKPEPLIPKSNPDPLLGTGAPLS